MISHLLSWSSKSLLCWLKIIIRWAFSNIFPVKALIWVCIKFVNQIHYELDKCHGLENVHKTVKQTNKNSEFQCF